MTTGWRKAKRHPTDHSLDGPGDFQPQEITLELVKELKLTYGINATEKEIKKERKERGKERVKVDHEGNRREKKSLK